METTQTTLTYPPSDIPQNLNLVEVLDFHTKHNPSAAIYTFSEDGKPGHTEISFLEFGRAVHRVAHHIRPAGTTIVNRETIAFVALSDSLLYQAVTLGIAKAGYIVRRTYQLLRHGSF